ncbi:MAG: DUF6690 family protein [Thermoguttaceae bacterium]
MNYRKAIRTLFIYVAVPLFCAGGPVAWFSGPKWWSGLTTSLASRPTTTPAAGNASEVKPLPAIEAPDLPATPAMASTTSVATGPVPASPDGTPLHEMAEVFRFDVSPRWIADNWPRVSTALGQLQLQGYRVPLVTGPAEDDIAGALTYYFNPWQKLQRITFIGTTGDVRKLITMLSAQFGFARRLTNDPGQFIYEVQDPAGKATSALWIRHVPVLKASKPRERYEINLTIERPAEK